jgi:hypothetical protein
MYIYIYRGLCCLIPYIGLRPCLPTLYAHNTRLAFGACYWLEVKRVSSRFHIRNPRKTVAALDSFSKKFSFNVNEVDFHRFTCIAISTCCWLLLINNTSPLLLLGDVNFKRGKFFFDLKTRITYIADRERTKLNRAGNNRDSDIILYTTV